MDVCVFETSLIPASVSVKSDDDTDYYESGGPERSKASPTESPEAPKKLPFLDLLPFEKIHLNSVPKYIFCAMLGMDLGEPMSESPGLQKNCLCDTFDNDPNSLTMEKHSCCCLYFPEYYITVFDPCLDECFLDIRGVLTDQYSATLVQLSTMFAQLAYIHHWFIQEKSNKLMSETKQEPVKLLHYLLNSNVENYIKVREDVLLEDYFTACVHLSLSLFYNYVNEEEEVDEEEQDMPEVPFVTVSFCDHKDLLKRSNELKFNTPHLKDMLNFLTTT